MMMTPSPEVRATATPDKFGQIAQGYLDAQGALWQVEKADPDDADSEVIARQQSAVGQVAPKGRPPVFFEVTAYVSEFVDDQGFLDGFYGAVGEEAGDEGSEEEPIIYNASVLKSSETAATDKRTVTATYFEWGTDEDEVSVKEATLQQINVDGEWVYFFGDRPANQHEGGRPENGGLDAAVVAMEFVKMQASAEGGLQSRAFTPADQAELAELFAHGGEKTYAAPEEVASELLTFSHAENLKDLVGEVLDARGDEAGEGMAVGLEATVPFKDGEAYVAYWPEDGSGQGLATVELRLAGAVQDDERIVRVINFVAGDAEEAVTVTEGAVSQARKDGQWQNVPSMRNDQEDAAELIEGLMGGAEVPFTAEHEVLLRELRDES